MKIKAQSEFDELRVLTEETTIFLKKYGSGDPLLLLHGFPETHFMWREIAPMLAKHFTVVCPDLRGYGESGCPVTDATHSVYSKRAMAKDMVEVMSRLGYKRFSIAGHDRGGRVAYRLALDHPDKIIRLAVLDIIPIAEAWDMTDKRMMTSFWPWSLLSQPFPLPEKLILGAAAAIINDASAKWGSEAEAFTQDAKEEYAKQLQDHAHVHAICEEFRAAATVDYLHDKSDESMGRRIQCPLLAIWSANGALNTWYDNLGGVLGLWRKWADDPKGFAINAGHFFPEEKPLETANALMDFFLHK